MGTSIVSVALSIAVVGQGTIKQEEIDYQKQAFSQWWGNELATVLDELPTKGKVEDSRVPYSGHDYPDSGGGTVVALAKYDQAFNRGQALAGDHERKDVGQTRGVRGRWRRGGGLLGRRRTDPGWYGHCNGWTAACIRHAEPQKNVTRNGVVFTPADIKGLLAEIYMYSDTEFLGGIDTTINPATLHLTMTNWLGRGSYPIGMEVTPGEVVFNYPAYQYSYTTKKQDDDSVEVHMTVTYAKSSGREVNRSPRIKAEMNFHYVLDLNDDGEIVGGRYYNNSSRIDMLWAPLQPKPSGEEGNKLGNPHVDVKEVLAIWRESVDEEVRKKWLNIDPTKEDRVLDDDEESDDTGQDT